MLWQCLTDLVKQTEVEYSLVLVVRTDNIDEETMNELKSKLNRTNEIYI